jgi:hypothetical protein
VLLTGAAKFAEPRADPGRGKRGIGETDIRARVDSMYQWTESCDWMHVTL